MAERKVQNKYYPPDWTPEQGSLNKYVGQHPLRERASKLHLGILTIRFEMPFNIWCNGCGRHIAMSVRFNAEKKRIGYYYSTPIYSFKMNCPSCPTEIEIQTDPKNSDYVVVGGGQRKTETWDPEEIGTVVMKDEATAKNLAENPFFKLEHENKDKQVARKAAPVISELLSLREQDWADDAASSKLLRKRFREEKKEIEKKDKEVKDLQKRASLAIPIVPETEEDIQAAKKLKFLNSNKAKDDLIQRAAKVQVGSIFNGSNPKENSIQLTKDRIERDKHLLELAVKKKKLGIDHRNFQILSPSPSKNSEMLPFENLIKVKRPDSKSPEIRQKSPENYSASEEENDPEAKVQSKLSSLVDY